MTVTEAADLIAQLEALEAAELARIEADLAAFDAAMVPLSSREIVAWIRDDGRHRHRCRALPARLRVAAERRRGLALVTRCDRSPVPGAPAPTLLLGRSLDRHAPPALGPLGGLTV